MQQAQSRQCNARLSYWITLTHVIVRAGYHGNHTHAINRRAIRMRWRRRKWKNKKKTEAKRGEIYIHDTWYIHRILIHDTNRARPRACLPAVIQISYRPSKLRHTIALRVLIVSTGGSLFVGLDCCFRPMNGVNLLFCPSHTHILRFRLCAPAPSRLCNFQEADFCEKNNCCLIQHTISR